MNRRVSIFRLPRTAPRARTGFTLVEVLATLLLIGIVLPTVMQGIELAGRAADIARHTTEATGLAESQLARMMTDPNIQAERSGDFAPEWPNYRWEATMQSFSDGSVGGANVQELDLRVIWISRGREDSVTVSTLVYPKAATALP